MIRKTLGTRDQTQCPGLKARTVSSQRVRSKCSSVQPLSLCLCLSTSLHQLPSLQPALHSDSRPLSLFSLLSPFLLLPTSGASSSSDVPTSRLIVPCETVSHECAATLAVGTGTVSRGSQCARGEIIAVDAVR